MDHSMMSDMGGMDMGSGHKFGPHDRSLAYMYWYLVAAGIGAACALKVLDIINPRLRQRSCRALSLSHPTRPRTILSQIYATSTAIAREIAYPSAGYFPQPWLEWLSPPPLGRSLAIITYWVIITLFLTTGSVVHDAYYWERIGFRAAWISVTQVPMIYLFAGKVNFLGMLFGSSYMDLNWIHKWVSRTLLITVTIHGGFFVTEWVRADFFKYELEIMPMVKWGLAAWSLLVWTTFSSVFPLRRLGYEFFVIQHIASAAVFLWLLYKHVPADAAYNLWMAVAFAVSGRLFQACVFFFRNLPTRMMGHVTEMEAFSDGVTHLTIRDVKCRWKAGQHILLWCPTLGPLESHPFTIANIARQNPGDGPKQIDLVIRARSGFTRRLQRMASLTQPQTMRAFITGPFGNLPTWNTFETTILISASTGASFTLPILESILNDPCCVSRIDCLFLARDRSHLEAYMPRLKAAASHPRAAEVELRILIAITGAQRNAPSEGGGGAVELKSLSDSDSSSDTASKGLMSSRESHSEKATRSLSAHGSDPSGNLNNGKDLESTIVALSSSPCTQSNTNNGDLRCTHSRPDLASIIRESVEASAGETSVVVCGGKSLTSTVRSCVASLADERAVHKGTGAQGIHLHVEGFGS